MISAFVESIWNEAHAELVRDDPVAGLGVVEGLAVEELVVEERLEEELVEVEDSIRESGVEVEIGDVIVTVPVPVVVVPLLGMGVELSTDIEVRDMELDPLATILNVGLAFPESPRRTTI